MNTAFLGMHASGMKLLPPAFYTKCSSLYQVIAAVSDMPIGLACKCDGNEDRWANKAIEYYPLDAQVSGGE